MKIGEYEQMMAYLTRPEPQSTTNINRENFYAGSSLEQYGSKIKNLYLKGTSTPKINEALKFEKDRSTTIDEFIKSMKSGKAPIKITVDELSKRPDIKGTNITGKPGERRTELSKWVKNFEKENGRLPSMQEAREKFDYSLVKKTGQTGEIKYLPSSEARSMGGLKPGQEDIIKLSKDPKVRNMFRTGEVNAKQIINHVKNILEKPDMSDDVAGGKLHALAEFFSGKKELEGIKPTFIENAKSISTNFPFKARIRDLREREIGKSVGEQSIKSDKSAIRRQDVYKDLGVSKVGSIDEPAGVTSSVKKGSTPYGVFAQIINKDLNSSDKMRFDSLKSNYEGKVKDAIEDARIKGIDPKQDKAVKKAVNEFNAVVTKYEKMFNKTTRPGDKKLNLLRISLDDPSKTVSRYNQLPDSYKSAFDNVYKNNGYSFKVPKDIKTIPEIKNDVIANPQKFAKNLGRPNAPRLYADVLPGFGNLMESISEDFKQGKYGKGSFKTLGALSIPVAGYFAQEEFRRGEPVLDIATSAVTGLKPTEAFARKFVPEEKGGYSDKERLARDQLKLLENIPTSSLDMSPLLYMSQKDPEYTGSPAGYIDFLKSKEEGIKSLATEAEKRFQEQVMQPFFQKKAMERGNLIEGIKSLIPNYGPVDPNMKLAFQSGGRVGFADGPEDPSKRKFMKIMGGLTSLPILGKFIKPAAKVAPAALEAAKGMPDWFSGLVSKVIETGTDITQQFAKQKGEQVFVKQLGEAEGVKVTKNLETGSVRVDYDSPTNMGEQSVSFTYRPGTKTEKGENLPAQFEAVEAEPRGIRSGPDDYDIEFDGENIVEDAGELMSDTSSLKQFATGKLDDADLKLRQQKVKKVESINNDQMEQAEYLETKYGAGDPDAYKQFPDDDL